MEPNKTKRAAGYIRVSSPEQAEEDKESLNVQRESINRYATEHGYKLIEIYADEGISGGTVKDRHALLRCLYDGQAGKFEIVIVHRLSRFGRNAVELLDNYETMKQAGIELRSISEGIDFSTKYGQAFLGILAVIAQLERDIITETMLESRIAKARKGIPTAGSLPYARTFDKKTGQWGLDETKANHIKLAAQQYIEGEGTPLRTLAKMLNMTPTNLSYIFNHHCGSEWTVTFKGNEPITYKIPPLLENDTIEKVKERLAFNRKNNRTDVTNKYVLSGFIYCYNCLSSLSGQTQVTNGISFQYYRHLSSTQSPCRAFSSIKAEDIERAVFYTILDNVADKPSYNRAIEASLPDEKKRNELIQKIQSNEKELKKINRELEKLVVAVLEKTLTKETIRNKEQKLLETKNRINDIMEDDRYRLKCMPTAKIVKQEAEFIRRKITQKYFSRERYHEMSYEEKRELLHWLFDGEDNTGFKYGIYIEKRGKGKEARIDYFMYGKIVGLRTLKGNDINFMGDVDEEIKREKQQLNNNYKTKKAAEICLYFKT